MTLDSFGAKVAAPEAENADLPFSAIEYVLPEYSRRQIEAAGKALTGTLTDVEEAVGLFRIAYNWRDAHVYPMRRVRAELAGAAKRFRTDGVTVARIKRMKSIRRKLRRNPHNLYQMQDIGGCRVIVPSIKEQRQLIGWYAEGGSRHGVISQSPYIERPTRRGYRSHHVVLKFSGDGETEVYNRQRIEAQIRTRLQHTWATAVEAAGMVRDEDLKGGEGDARWLRLFEIMGSEIAALEASPSVPGVPENETERRDELRYLDDQINALANLKNWNNAVKAASQFSRSASNFYVVQYDPETKRVTVEPSIRITQSTELLIQEEQQHAARDTVMIELDKVEDLREAYPNYFLDLTVFNSILRGALTDKSAAEMRETVAPIMPPEPKARGVWNFRFGRWGRL